LVLTDLDDTLFSTARKQAEVATCAMVALSKKGTPSAYQNPVQAAIWAWLNQLGAVVPVTARNRAGLDRVTLPFSRHAIWNHGASIAIDGERDEPWHAAILGDLIALEPLWEPLCAALATWAQATPGVERADLRNTPHVEFGGHRFQLEIKAPGIGAHGPAIAAIARSIVGDALWVYPHYDVIALLPRRAHKETAAARLLATLKPNLTIGVGDSPSDLSFMRLCHFVMAPSQSLLVKMAVAGLTDNLAVPTAQAPERA